MNVDELRRAYADFSEAARRGRFARPSNGDWSAEMILAHLVVGDRLIAEAAARVMSGCETRFDNRASQSEPYLQSVIEASGSWQGLLEAVQRSGAELMALALRMTDEQASTPIPAKIVSGDEVVLDRIVPIGNLVRGPADVHLRLHVLQLEALAR
jgi:hypothetical protein